MADERQRVRLGALVLAAVALVLAAVLLALQLWYAVAGAVLVTAGAGWAAARMYTQLHEEEVARLAQARARAPFVDPVPEQAERAVPERRTPF